MSSNDNFLYKSVIISGPTSITPQGTVGSCGEIFVSSATTGTIAIYSGQSNAGVKLIDTFTVNAGQNYTIRVNYRNGLFIDTTGALSATVKFN